MPVECELYNRVYISKLPHGLEEQLRKILPQDSCWLFEIDKMGIVYILGVPLNRDGAYELKLRLSERFNIRKDSIYFYAIN